MTHDNRKSRPPVGSTGTLAELQVEAGDVVEWLSAITYEKGRLYTIGANGNALHLDGGWIDRNNHSARMRLISRANPDQPLQIEAGKYYRTRDGRKVGPMRHDQGAKGGMMEWRAPDNPGSTKVAAWYSSGRMLSHTTHADDLIAEWQDDQPAHIITHEGHLYDLTALDTPFGLLPEPVQEALLAWPYGVYVSYRAIPAEIRIQCYRGGRGVNYEYGTCIKNPDGSIDWASWKDAE